MRVIGGMTGGLRLDTPKGPGVRPTLDRVRESIFAALGDLRGTRVVDLYAGTGALGIEALSRGAEFALFVERASRPLQCLQTNVDRFISALEHQDEPVPEIRLWAGDVRDVPGRMAESSGTFGIILADPPYGVRRGGGQGGEALALLGREDFVKWAGEAILVLEHDAHAAGAVATQPRWTLLRQKRYGRVAVSFLRGRK